MITAGIDAGAATTKALLFRDREIIGYRIGGTAFDFLTAARNMFDELLASCDIRREEVGNVYATGYGRNSISFADKSISEITAHAKGVSFLFPEVQGIIDVGGQDSKVIVVEDGRVADFLMNDKCAAGTGKFLEYTAKALEVPINDLGGLALASDHPADITSMCTVFAESEVISLRARGITKEDIAAGLIASIATAGRGDGEADGIEGSYRVCRRSGEECRDEGSTREGAGYHPLCPVRTSDHRGPGGCNCRTGKQVTPSIDW